MDLSRLFATTGEVAQGGALWNLLVDLLKNTGGGAGPAGLSHVLFVDQSATGPGARGSLELSGRFPTIQVALDAMQPGDIVLLNPDTYSLGSSGLDWPALAGSFNVGTLMGLATATTQIVNDGTRPILTIAQDNAVAILRNLTLVPGGSSPAIRAIGQGGISDLVLVAVDGGGGPFLEASDWYATVVQGNTSGSAYVFTDCGLLLFDKAGSGFNRPDLVITSPKGAPCTLGLTGSLIDDLSVGTAMEPMPFGLQMDATSTMNSLNAYLTAANSIVCQGGRFTANVSVDFGGVASAGFLGCTFQGNLLLTSSGTRTHVLATACQWTGTGNTIQAGAFVDLSINGAAYPNTTLVSSGGADAGTIDRDTYEASGITLVETDPGVSGIYEVPFTVASASVPFPAGITAADYVVLFTPCNQDTVDAGLYNFGGDNVRAQLKGGADVTVVVDVQIVRKPSPTP